MRDAEVPVVFLPERKTVYVLPDTRLLEAAAEAGIVLDYPCGGQGVCRKCRVRLQEGAAAPTPDERPAFTAAELAAGWRLACQAEVSGAAVVEVPPTGPLAVTHQIQVQGTTTAAAALEPAVRKTFVTLRPPARGDDAPDLVRLETALGRFQPDWAVVRQISARLREGEFRGTAVLLDDRLIDFEPGDTTARRFAAAVDVGTTTLAAELLDLGTGRSLATAARLNPQSRLGDDVLSRIVHAAETPEGLAGLQTAVIAAVNDMLAELCGQAGIERQHVYEVVLAGNTTMQQLFCGLDPQWLGVSPFVPTAGRGMAVAAAELGLEIHPRGRAHLMPVIGSFVGGDTTAGILATGLCDTPGPTLLVDIGTNGEIVLWSGGELQAASTAAGPAFEGARIAQGMRGSSGAIEKVVVDGHLRINVIGNVAPLGICGSGLIDAAAELLRQGLLTPQGRLLRPDQLPAATLPDLAARVTVENGQAAFVLATADESGCGRPIALTQRDFRELQLASGAIRAGIGIVLRQAGLRPEDLDAVLLAGGFGSFIRRKNAQRIGLLPQTIERRRIRFQGNTSLAGARLAALSVSARRHADEIARRTRHVDLSSDPEFRAAFADAMIFPDA